MTVKCDEELISENFRSDLWTTIAYANSKNFIMTQKEGFYKVFDDEEVVFSSQIESNLKS